MSENDFLNPLYQFLPIDIEELPVNEALRQIADSLAFLQEQILTSYNGEPFVPTQQYRLYGVNDDIDASPLPEDVSNIPAPNPALVWPTTAATARVISSSANDAAAGTGAQTIRLFGVDANLDYVTEDVTMNGTTAVFSTTQFLFVHLACGINVGSQEINDGDIDIDIDRTNVIQRIGALRGQSQGSHFLVPNPIIPGKAAFVTQAQITASRNNGYVLGDLIVKRPNESIRAAASWGVDAEGGPLISQLVPFVPTVPGTRIWARVTEVQGSTNNWFVRVSYTVAYYDELPSDTSGFGASGGVIGSRQLDGGIG